MIQVHAINVNLDLAIATDDGVVVDVYLLPLKLLLRPDAATALFAVVFFVDVTHCGFVLVLCACARACAYACASAHFG